MSQEVIARTQNGETKRKMIFENVQMLEELLGWLDQHGHTPVILPEERYSSDQIKELIFNSAPKVQGCNLMYLSISGTH